MKGHTALGGANLGLFGSASIFAWPASVSVAADAFCDSTTFDRTNVHDDSVGRSNIWGLASTTIGATLHETGHTFGLPHCGDRFGIMSRGFDHFNRCFTLQDARSGRNRIAADFVQKEEAYFCPESASYLRWSRWFGLDKAELSDSRPTITIDKAVGTVEIECPSGVAWVGFHVGDNIRTFREFDSTKSPKLVKLTLAEISKDLKGKKLSRIRALSRDGIETGRKIDD